MARCFRLYQRGNRYYCRTVVPIPLRGIVGQSELWKSLGADRVAAMRVLPTVAAEHDERIREARKGTKRERPQGLLASLMRHFDETSVLMVPDAFRKYGETLSLSSRKGIDHRRVEEVVCHFIGGKPMRTIRRAELQPIVDFFVTLPKNAATRYPGVSLVRAAELAKAAGVEPISGATVVTYLARITSFFKWAHRRGFIDTDPSQYLAAEIRVQHKKRASFTDDEIAALFSEPPSAERYYPILIGACTGMRLAEVINLTVTDITPASIRVDEEYDHQRVKTQSSVRIIPLPEPCRSLLDFAATKDHRLFDATPPSYSKWFARYCAAKGIDKSFHCLRHRYVSICRRAQVPIPIMRTLVGHSRPDGDTTSGYGDGYPLEVLAEWVARLNFGI